MRVTISISRSRHTIVNIITFNENYNCMLKWFTFYYLFLPYYNFNEQITNTNAFIALLVISILVYLLVY